MTRIDVSQVRRLAVDLGKVGARATLAASRVVAKTALQVEATAKSLAPVDTGALRNSIGVDHDILRAEIGPTVAYAEHVEFGTARMAPQPYMGPALDRHTPDFIAALEAVAGRALG